MSTKRQGREFRGKILADQNKWMTIPESRSLELEARWERKHKSKSFLFLSLFFNQRAERAATMELSLLPLGHHKLNSLHYSKLLIPSSPSFTCKLSSITSSCSFLLQNSNQLISFIFAAPRRGKLLLPLPCRCSKGPSSPSVAAAAAPIRGRRWLVSFLLAAAG